MYVFVAATDRSSPASSSSTDVRLAREGRVEAFVIATVGRPWRRASASTDATSGDAPDCEIPRTTAPSSRGGCS